jgi:hypothetical protein
MQAKRECDKIFDDAGMMADPTGWISNGLSKYIKKYKGRRTVLTRRRGADSAADEDLRYILICFEKRILRDLKHHEEYNKILQLGGGCRCPSSCTSTNEAIDSKLSKTIEDDPKCASCELTAPP